MKLPIRLENAITKLYTAFHEGSLKAMDCQACAVGNICDNDDSWDDLPVFMSTSKWGNDMEYGLDAVSIRRRHNRAKATINKTGYSVENLINVEKLFLKACDFRNGSKDQQFKGLCAVVEYLCELDNIPNVMYYTKLFETENNKPKYELSL